MKGILIIFVIVSRKDEGIWKLYKQIASFEGLMLKHNPFFFNGKTSVFIMSKEDKLTLQKHPALSLMKF